MDEIDVSMATRRWLLGLMRSADVEIGLRAIEWVDLVFGSLLLVVLILSSLSGPFNHLLLLVGGETKARLV